MKALYTETFKEFLENNASNVDLLAIIFKIENNFSGFEFYVDENGTTVKRTVSFYLLLYNKFKFREIGYETEDLFIHALDRKADEVIIKYAQKVDMVAEKFPSLLSHKIDMTDEENYYEYLAPTLSNPNNYQVNNSMKRQRDYQRLTGIITTDVDLLNKFQEIKSLYYEAIEAFESIFMGCF